MPTVVIWLSGRGQEQGEPAAQRAVWEIAGLLD